MPLELRRQRAVGLILFELPAQLRSERGTRRQLGVGREYVFDRGHGGNFTRPRTWPEQYFVLLLLLTAQCGFEDFEEVGLKRRIPPNDDFIGRLSNAISAHYAISFQVMTLFGLQAQTHGSRSHELPRAAICYCGPG